MVKKRKGLFFWKPKKSKKNKSIKKPSVLSNKGKKKLNFTKSLKSSVNKDIELLRKNEVALRLLKTEELKRVRLKEQKQIQLIKKKSQKEQKQIIERFDKKAALMGSKLLKEKQRQTGRTVDSEIRALKRNQLVIKNLNKQIGKLLPKKEVF